METSSTHSDVECAIRAHSGSVMKLLQYWTASTRVYIIIRYHKISIKTRVHCTAKLYLYRNTISFTGNIHTYICVYEFVALFLENKVKIKDGTQIL